MFTGIITAKSRVLKSKKFDNGMEISFELPKDWGDVEIGESIAVNGMCLTVKSITVHRWSAFLMTETISRVNIPSEESEVNLERAMKFNERLSGHLVQGHIDCVGKVVKIATENELKVYIEFPVEYKNLVIEKGSIAINGVSLTVVSCENNILSVAVIPHTMTATTLGAVRENEPVNIEFDIIGKYVTKSLSREVHAKS